MKTMAEIMVRFDDLRIYCEKHKCGSVPLEYIKQMPTIEAEPLRHGQWSECWHDERIYSGICSTCEKASIRPVDSEPLKFCPKCGARMDGGNENAD